MTFSVLMYAVGAYAVVLLAVMLYVEKVREPVPQSAPQPHDGVRAQLRAWRRTARRCPVAQENALPLRSARHAAPPRRQRLAQTSCRR
jgi:hypothetical protein